MHVNISILYVFIETIEPRHRQHVPAKLAKLTIKKYSASINSSIGCFSTDPDTRTLV
jgi:hypothetical protein